MAVTITDINDTYPTGFPDGVIQRTLDGVNDLMGYCVTTSYPSESLQDSIIIYATLYLLDSMNGAEATSERSANGAATTRQIQGGGDGLKSNRWGRLLMQLDSGGCSGALVPDTAFMFTIGSTDRSKY